MSPALQFVLLLACAFLSYRAVHHARMALVLRRGDIIRERHVLDSGDLPDALHDIGALLTSLGFAPVYAIAQRYALQRQPTTIYAHRHDMGIYASLAPAAGEPPFTLTLISVFADDSMVATTYPHGTEASTPDLDLRFALYDPVAAFDDHVIRTLRWSEAHGEPVINDDPVSGAAVDRRLTARHLFDHVIRKNEGAVLSLLGLVAILGAILWPTIAPAVQGADSSANVIAVIPALFTDTIVTISGIFVGVALVVASNIRSEPARKPKPLDSDLKPAQDQQHPLARPPRTR